jgi:alpha-D-ribose 1-methylphosphonate 5-triphosphate synthase subunit PhnH
MITDALTGGFVEASTQSARAFRAALEAMARPGSIWKVEGAAPPAPLSVAAGVLVLTLCDGTTPVYLGATLDQPALRDWITFHCGAPFTTAGEARFAIGSWDDLTPISRFAVGTPDYPDRSATLIVEMPTLSNTGPRLTGPGIDGKAALSLPETTAFQHNRTLFPQGFDTYLTCGNRLAGLPRSAVVEVL